MSCAILLHLDLLPVPIRSGDLPTKEILDDGYRRKRIEHQSRKYSECHRRPHLEIVMNSKDEAITDAKQ